MAIPKANDPLVNIIRNKYIDVNQGDLIAVIRAFKRGKFSGTAKIVEEYEMYLERFFGVKHALATSNGTAAIYLALAASKVGLGDEVMLPPTAPVMTVMPILAFGAKPVFVDVAPGCGFSLSLLDVKKKISSKTRAIISVPMWGYPVAEEQIRAICHCKKIAFILDCSQAHGTRRPSGLLGTGNCIGVFSTHERKLVNTGEGGFLLTNDSAIASLARSVRAFGVGKNKTFGVRFGLNFKLNALSCLVR